MQHSAPRPRRGLALAVLLVLTLTVGACQNFGQHPDPAFHPPTMVLYNSPPIIAHFHLEDTARAHGEIVSWHADLDDAEGKGATRIGHCNGTMQVTRDNDGHGDDREHRMTTIELDWDDSDDSLLIAGSHPYRHGVVQSDTRMIRAIIGGTGRFMGARGQMISERLQSGWYRHSIWLIDSHGR
ncbi:MAG: hypothetical protein VYE77_04835 [Planctomycetota bacterium]|nr:hypothetical protein [Planctomycetota bacterium]